MEIKLAGVIPALVTPFDEAGQIDERAFRQQIRFMLEKKVHGFCVGGSTGEGHALAIDEVRRLTAVAMEETNGRVPVVTGIIATSTRDAILRAQAVGDLGVAALQITPTFYVFKADEDDTFRHFKAISEAVPLPIIIYNVIRTNELSAELLVRIMSEIPGVAGVKQSQGNIKLMADLLIMVPPGKRVYAAIDALLYPCFVMGAHGTIAAIPTAVPGPCVTLWNAVKDGDHEKGLRIHEKMLAFFNTLHHPNNPACVKYALSLQGCCAGFPRAPMPAVSSRQQACIKPALEALLALDQPAETKHGVVGA
jgi:4-hydroxy-tetrahydrodipicolinate synthase